jgi:hypothetical protein
MRVRLEFTGTTFVLGTRATIYGLFEVGKNLIKLFGRRCTWGKVLGGAWVAAFAIP